MNCPYCGSSSGTEHRAREMMFGLREEFAYRECHGCGCLRLLDVPHDVARYYGNQYYSLAAKQSPWLCRVLRRSLYFGALRWPLLTRTVTRDFAALAAISPARHMRILDVGCGAGDLVGKLRELGFDALGIDPLIREDVRDEQGLRVQKCTIAEVQGSWDIVTFHHSLEHICDQVGTLRRAREILRPGGTCIVRLPVVAWAWRNYGANWVQLDAPRHVVLHTRQSFALAAQAAGFQVTSVNFDSNEFQFWGSEVYARGVALCQADISMFSLRQRLAFRRRARELNRTGDADSAVFYLRIPPTAASGATVGTLPEPSVFCKHSDLVRVPQQLLQRPGPRRSDSQQACQLTTLP